MSSFPREKLTKFASNQYALVGGMNSGKTTIIKEFKKAGFRTVNEKATQVIEINGTEVVKDLNNFNHLIEEYQLLAEASHRASGELTILDRGIYDNIAYFEVDHKRPAPLLHALDLFLRQLPQGGAIYEMAFVLETVDKWEFNGVRTEGGDPGDEEKAKKALQYSRRLADTMERVYEDRGIPTVRVPVVPVAERFAFILAHIVKHQHARLEQLSKKRQS
jgi:predicted ATPase